jgi:DNA-binding CsgD family transcriptional regulator
VAAIEHLKTLCCLGLTPEATMVAASPLLHEIVPHEWSRWALLETDRAISRVYSENPATLGVFRERMWSFRDDRTSPMSLWQPCFDAVGIGWTLHMQGRGWHDTPWYKELELPLDSCWILDAMVGEAGRTNAIVSLTRPRRMKPFDADHVKKLDRIRPWLAHALRRPSEPDPNLAETACYTAGAPFATGEIVLAHDGTILYQTCGVDYLLWSVIEGKTGNSSSLVTASEKIGGTVRVLINRLTGSSRGFEAAPPRLTKTTPYGAVTLEARWLVPPNSLPHDVARDPRSCLVGVRIELHEHAAASAARVLREKGVTPAQIKVGVRLALGKAKSEIADELGLTVATVGDLTKKLYRALEVHSAAELGTKVWLSDHESGPGFVPAAPKITHGWHRAASRG